jgi:hypothetical protein
VNEGREVAGRRWPGVVAGTERVQMRESGYALQAADKHGSVKRRNGDSRCELAGALNAGRSSGCTPID